MRCALQLQSEQTPSGGGKIILNSQEHLEDRGREKGGQCRLREKIAYGAKKKSAGKKLFTRTRKTDGVLNVGAKRKGGKEKVRTG